ncbi:MAG TPA: SpoIIE family protein phosphatase [Polyangia bacterium]|nr:SpoIIE family protein phosphatase [Polyangia bacterium]
MDQNAAAVVRNLLVLYSGLLLINVALSAALWYRNRNPLYRALFFVWATTAASFVVQGALAATPLQLALSFVSVFPVNLALAHLVSLATEVDLPWRRFVAVMAAGVGVSVGLSLYGAGFTPMALPIAVAVSLPSLVTAARVIATRWRGLRISAKALLVSSILFSAHNVDFAFLRDKPAFASLGFTIATLIIFALSVTGPAVVLELVTEREARIATEMDTARRIQTKILPRDTVLPGLELVSYLRPAQSVGGDYLDLYTFGDDCWLLLGDVTGHGLGAGLVMLMAQSTISSILQTKPDVSPRELNWLANRVLCRNLARLDESRHMTVASLRRTAGNLFTVSGCHDDIMIVRDGGQVERRTVAHFPMGLGFIDQLSVDQMAEDTFSLGKDDLLFIGTDGITEALRGGDPRRGILGEEAVSDLLVRHAREPLVAIKSALVQRLEEFTNGVYADDAAFLLVRARAGDSA